MPAPPDGCGAGTAASASFAGGGTQATATSGATRHRDLAGPHRERRRRLVHRDRRGLGSAGGAGATEGAGKAGDPSVAPVGFSLVNLAGKPAKIAPGVGSTQSTPAGSAFPIRLAVTVTDAEKNPVPGALVTFSAPAAGASGRFALRVSGSHHRRAPSHTPTRSR